MTILTDGIHLVSTESEIELHLFAVKIDLERRWYQHHPNHPHYDLTTPAAKLRAIDSGAQLVSRRQLVRMAWWATPSVH